MMIESITLDGNAATDVAVIDGAAPVPLGTGFAWTGYFNALPSARATLESSMVSGSYVTARERASWKTKDGTERSQAALAVYEIRDGLIARVWYYPAE